MSIDIMIEMDIRYEGIEPNYKVAVRQSLIAVYS